MVRTKSKEQVEKNRELRLKSTVSLDPDPELLDAFAAEANSEHKQVDPKTNMVSTSQQHPIGSTQGQQDGNNPSTGHVESSNTEEAKNPPKETHLHVILHPDVKETIRKIALDERRKMSEVVREMILGGLKAGGHKIEVKQG